MVKEVVTLLSKDEVILTLSENLHKDLCRLLAAMVQENKRSTGDYIESAINRSYELMTRLRESSPAG